MKRLELESKKDSRASFTLIEVLVSVIIISIVGLALLDMANKNTKMIGFLATKKEVPMILSVYGFHGEPDLDNLEKNLYDVISKNYTIDSLSFKNYLNSKKILYKEDEVERKQIFDGEQFSIIKQTVSSTNQGGFLYTLRTEK
ncbi:MAG: prepilin-type N-terminal cleavage/methylation domain-containing protein [Campylobacterales bacterium]|nr:prepilin-type N-terminal cleavage/methylation domain-containing protein [Campylobacterales bacterium]